jgi:hypothetical protein
MRRPRAPRPVQVGPLASRSLQCLTPTPVTVSAWASPDK